ncbi:hypothetical protein E2562_031515 [Oryza meyeriana var. granulata]|uniref:DUF834 domain-containing protein n=1 Tax=Oryza meyeriana var. granulata TaxID=110450 RepID=A0A6G1ERQ5_9ORYZ|nr:hypothetical protein E2562_031515 [Oryza meyeriana var. granulata]
MRSRFGRKAEEVTTAEEELGRGHRCSLPSSCLCRRLRRRRFGFDESKARFGEPEVGYGELGGDALTRMGGGGLRRRGRQRPDEDGGSGSMGQHRRKKGGQAASAAKRGIREEEKIAGDGESEGEGKNMGGDILY